MSKEKVFIVLMHKNVLKSPATKIKEAVWEVEERVEFVNQVRNKHIQTGTAIADYINRKMISGARYGMTDYDKFEEYVTTKYKDQMKQLGAAYRNERIVEESQEVFADEFGNIRPRTVFDVA